MFDFKAAGVKAHKMRFTASDCGLTSQSPRQEVLTVLSEISEGKAICRYERENAMVVFIGIPGINQSGAIYLFTKRDGEFWLLEFDGVQDTTLTKGQCERLFTQYHLAELAYRPNLVFPPQSTPAQRRYRRS